MTQDEIIEMARDSGMELYGLGKDRARFVHFLVAFANLVAAKATEEANARANASWELMCKKMVAFEREAIAWHFENHWKGEYTDVEIAAAVRARR